MRTFLRDHTTDLLDPAPFADRISEALARCERTDQTMSLLLIDFDDFDDICDMGAVDLNLGRHTRDMLATVMAERLLSLLRASDAVTRLRADAFAVLLDGTDQPSAELVASRILDEIGRPVAVKGRDLAVRASVGIVAVRSYVPAEDLLRNAEAAARAARSRGRGQYQVFRPEMHLVAHASALEQELRRALDVRELVAYYQPIVHLGTGHVVGIEALARWDHPHMGILAAEAFVPLAEETGLIVTIGEQLLREAAAFVERVDRSGTQRAANLWINLSGRQLRQPDLVPFIEDALAGSGLDPSRLVVEIAEQVLVANGEGIELVLGELRDLGIGLAADDVGWGHASLLYLRSLPIDTLKIDRAFVAGAAPGSQRTAVAHAVAELGQALGFATVAKGIETPEQHRELLGKGCTQGQGFLLFPPLSPAEAEALLAGA